MLRKTDERAGLTTPPVDVLPVCLPLPSAHGRRQATLTTARRQPGRPADKDWQAEATKWKALARKHEKAAKDNADAAKSLADIEESGKSNLGNAQWPDGLAKRRWTVRPVSGLRRSAVGLDSEVSMARRRLTERQPLKSSLPRFTTVRSTSLLDAADGKSCHRSNWPALCALPQSEDGYVRW